MEQISIPLNTRWSSDRASKKKRIILRTVLLLFLVFAIGFFTGIFVASINLLKEDPSELAEVIEEVIAPANEPEKTELPWNLTLVNFENALPEDYAPEKLLEVDNGYMVDSRVMFSAKQMISDAYQKDGVGIIALSAYRDYQYQQDLYDNKVLRLMQEGRSLADATAEAATVVALPGTSEHQLGLALDLVDARHVDLDESQENTAAYKWLYEHCAEYGFIVRYPNGKTDITGIIYEPWHFRYVGKDAAKVIMDKHITLEEYLSDYYTE